MLNVSGEVFSEIFLLLYEMWYIVKKHLDWMENCHISFSHIRELGINPIVSVLCKPAREKDAAPCGLVSYSISLAAWYNLADNRIKVSASLVQLLCSETVSCNAQRGRRLVLNEGFAFSSVNLNIEGWIVGSNQLFSLAQLLMIIG